MPDPYQKCNRVATIIKLNEKIMLVDSIYVINHINSLSKGNEAARRMAP